VPLVGSLTAGTEGIVRRTALEIVRRLQKADFTAYWVGGSVRDQLLGKEPQDYDIATNAKPDQIEALFSRTIPVGRKFGVIIVVEQGHQFQVATFRADSDYQDGRRPTNVAFGDARADALRRDFTINGLFFDPVAGQLHDWVQGETDLRTGLIRTIGTPADRFAEDHLRMLRAVRFAAQLFFKIEPQTFTAIQEHAAKILRISAERVREELLKLFRPPHAARGLDLLRDSGLLIHVLPEIEATIRCDQSPNYHPEGTVYNHIRLILDSLPKDPPDSLTWSAMLHDIGKVPTASRDEESGRIRFYGHEKVGADMAAKLLRRLRFPRKEIEEITTCVLHHMQFKDVPHMKKSTLRRVLLRPTFPLELELHRLDCLGSHGQLDIYEFLREQQAQLDERPSIRPPLITGADLLAMGMKESPGIGSLLARIREKQLSDELKTPEEALAWVQRRLARRDAPE